MTQVVLMHRRIKEQPSLLVGSEAKNPLPSYSDLTWNDLAGLSWLIIEGQDKYELDSM